MERAFVSGATMTVKRLADGVALGVALSTWAGCGAGEGGQPPMDGGGLADASAVPVVDGATSLGPGGCAPRTCAEQGVACGPAGDGCGGLLACGTCTSPHACGGSGPPSLCGDAHGAGVCAPRTCAALGTTCGPAGDGCGAALRF